ncbi:MAG: GTPase ObgE [Kiritimatiellaeota bacterium]|nr:GTPase ObgE [Kiritimatiellota bacterium]
MKPIVFKDRVKIYARAGNGGNGVVAFFRDKTNPHGGPDGGDGGHGGSVILRGNPNSDSLTSLHYEPHQRAQHGGNGAGNNKHGRNGKDKIIPVPLGTVVKDSETEEFIGEILEKDQEMVIAKGGFGGLGNQRYKSSTNQTPEQCKEGSKGDDNAYRLELKLVADVGLVGYPSAGKSTLLTVLTDATPKVAAYPFTTLNPILGTLQFEDYSRIRIADIPGLIDGAAEGVGLGHYFLRHIERSSFLIFVIDMAAEDGRDPAEDYRNLRKELEIYNPELTHRPCLIVANKMDEEAAAENLAEFKKETGLDPLPISAGLGDGCEKIKEILYDHFFET